MNHEKGFKIPVQVSQTKVHRDYGYSSGFKTINGMIN